MNIVHCCVVLDTAMHTVLSKGWYEYGFFFLGECMFGFVVCMLVSEWVQACIPSMVAWLVPQCHEGALVNATNYQRLMHIDIIFFVCVFTLKNIHHFL